MWQRLNKMINQEVLGNKVPLYNVFSFLIFKNLFSNFHFAILDKLSAR